MPTCPDTHPNPRRSGPALSPGEPLCRSRFCVLSHVFPPAESGQAVVLYRLLCGVPADDYVLVCRGWDGSPAATLPAQRATQALPGRYVSVGPQGGWRHSQPVPSGRAVRFAGGVLSLLSQACSIARLARREHLGAIVACSGDLWDLPVGYLASVLSGRRFIAYVFDDYVYQWTHARQRWLANQLAPIVLRGAGGVIVPNEFLVDEYQRRYAVTPVVVRNPCAGPEVRTSLLPWPRRPGEVRILYTGAIYHAHFNAFRNLLGAISQVGDAYVRLHLYTGQTESVLRGEGIAGPVVYHHHVPATEAETLQREADILFLPLAFGGEIPRVVRTSAPGKMGEYLASGRPVLAHVPHDSFVSWFFRLHGCGVVVDRLDPVALATGIRQIAQGGEARERWGRNAQLHARAEFLPDVARARFLAVLARVSR